MNKKNKRIILFSTVAVLIAIVAIVVVLKVKDANEGYRTISVVETSGTVVVVQDGREYQAYSGMKLQEGYELVTSGNSYVRLVLDGDKYIKVEAGSKMVFETLGMLGSGKTRLTLERGAMTSELVSPLKTDEEYVVNTPNAVLAVRGTYFRLDLKPTENGEIVADVVTYGGKVATKRVQPSGEVVEEEVLVEAGRKVCINMDEHKTSYVVEGIKLEETDEDVVMEEVTQPIKIEDIPDEDIVDIYYSAQNGHKLFVTEKEVEEKIKDRDIKLEEYVSVYKKAEEVKKKQEGKLVETEVYADDSKPIAIAPEQGMDGEIPKENQIIVGIAPTDGDGVHSHAYVENVSKEATCTEAGEKTFTCECGETYTEEIPMLGHTKVTGGTVECHSKCSVCDAIIEDGTMHVYTDAVTASPTCTLVGEKTFTCECGHVFTEEIPMLGHTKVTGGTVECHSKCSVCDAIIEDGTMHVYTDAVTASPTCTLVGEKTFTCECGHIFTEEIPMTEHTKVAGGNVDCHSKCSVCEFVLEDGTNHVYTEMVTKEATHSEDGIKTYTCECGYGYEVPIPALQHIKVNGGTKDCHSKCSDCGAVLEDEISHSYTTTVLLEPTCTADGTKRLVCACGYEYLELIPALGHDYANEYSVDREPTCTEVGSKSRHCVRCESKSGATQIPMIAHVKVSGGTKDCHSKCSVCGNTIEDATSHSYAETVTKEPTCTEVGTMLYTCSCGYKYSGDIAALGHDYADKFTTDKAPTCTEAGSESKHCSRCDSVTEIRQVSATGHSYVDKIELPTNTSDGRDYEKCNACGDEINEIPIIAINAVNFPDETVRTYVEANFNSNEEAGLRPEEIAGAINLEIEEGQTVTSLKGVEHLTALEMLFVPDASGISDGEIDVTKNTALTTIALPNAKITKLDVSNNSALQMLMLSSTDISSLDVSSNDELFYLYVDNSLITSLDVSGKSNLQYLVASGSKLSSINVDNCTSLQSLQVANTALTSLDTSTLSGLYELSCDNTDISEIDLSSSSSLSRLFINGCDKLTSLDVSGTSLSEITLSDNTNLKTLDISDTDISAIDLSSNKKLENFAAKGFAGSELTISGCTNLVSVDLDGAANISNLAITGCSAFTTHDFSAYSSLKTLDISGSGIDSVSMSNNTSINALTAQNCMNLTSLTLDGCTSLSNLTLDGSTEITYLNVAGISESELDIRELEELEELFLNGSNITTLSGSEEILNFSYNPKLITLGLNRISSFSGIDLSENAALETLYSNVGGFTEVSFPANSSLKDLRLVAASNLETLDVSGCGELLNLQVSNSTKVTSINASGCAKLPSIVLTGSDAITSLNLSGCESITNIDLSAKTALQTLDISGSGIESIDVSNNTAIVTLTAQNCEGLTSLNVSSCSALSSLDVANSVNLNTLKVDFCTSLVSLDMRTLANLEVFSAGAAGIKTLSGDSTCLDLSYNKNLRDVQVNNLTSFSQINLTENAKLEKFLYNLMPMSTIDLSGCSKLGNFQISGAGNITALDFSNCPNIYRVIAQNSGNLSNINFDGCTKLMDARFAGSNNISSVDLTNAGSEVELGAYQEGKYLVFTVTAGTTTKSAIENATGWDSTIMSFA